MSTLLVCFFLDTFNQVEEALFCSHFAGSFYHEWMLKFFKYFFLHLSKCSYGFKTIYSINVVNYIDFSDVKTTLILGINPIWPWYIFYIYCRILFVKILSRGFAFVFMRYIGLSFSFFVMSLSGLVALAS